MADPNHIFSNEDVLVLDTDDVGNSERIIRGFRQKTGKLCLELQETLKEGQLSTLSESLSMLSAKHILEHFWYASYSTGLTVATFVARFIVHCKMSDAGFEAMENFVLNNLDDSIGIYLTY